MKRKALVCEHDRGICHAPNTDCPHWMGTFCELDIELDVYYNESTDYIQHCEIYEPSYDAEDGSM